MHIWPNLGYFWHLCLSYGVCKCYVCQTWLKAFKLAFDMGQGKCYEGRKKPKKTWLSSGSHTGLDSMLSFKVKQRLEEKDKHHIWAWKAACCLY